MDLCNVQSVRLSPTQFGPKIEHNYFNFTEACMLTLLINEFYCITEMIVHAFTSFSTV